MFALQELDLRNCRIVQIGPSFFSSLERLQQIFLSNNQITVIDGHPFPSAIVRIDLSYNTQNLMTQGLEMLPKVFANLTRLRYLDFSHTKLNPTAMTTFNSLPTSLTSLSVCYSELPSYTGIFINCTIPLMQLDISGNPRLSLNPSTFTYMGESLTALSARNSNVKNLDWTENLKGLQYLDLYDNNIHSVFDDSFSHMQNLRKLNLEKNSIGNWYKKLFSQNQKLEILNLRENKLTLLTNDMKEDMSSVQMLAIGKNEFECTCALQMFVHQLFEATRRANISALKDFREREIEDEFNQEDLEFNDESLENIPEETTRATLGVRNYLRPEYDVITRLYQKYFEMVEKSNEALRIRTKSSKSMSLSRSLVAKSNVGRDESFDDLQTILFDYDEDDDDYQCMNATAKAQQPIIDLDTCSDEGKETSPPPYNRDNLLLSLYIAIPIVITFSAAVIVIYWKWWYVKYFFVLCKNSAILTFMDDNDSGKEAIVTGKNDEPVETFLYDVFVSYSESNRDWVLDEFITNVEKRESINVCLHERDFQVGYGILENIVSCMDRSRCLLLLVSENFLLSQWCQFEMNLAQHRLLETRREKLILVLLEDIPVKKQPKTLKYLMRTKTYIKWPSEGSDDEKKLFWKRLKKAIISSKWETNEYGSIA
jgi:Leucine-rich repeat (LRR) protein